LACRRKKGLDRVRRRFGSPTQPRVRLCPGCLRRCVHRRLAAVRRRVRRLPPRPSVLPGAASLVVINVRPLTAAMAFAPNAFGRRNILGTCPWRHARRHAAPRAAFAAGQARSGSGGEPSQPQ
jgi:hypothetical protein